VPVTSAAGTAAEPVESARLGVYRLRDMSMIHDNLPASIEDLSARIIAIRDSL
jgi:hypothetical protein